MNRYSYLYHIDPYNFVLQQNILYYQLAMSNLPKIPDDQYLQISNQGLQYIMNNFDPQLPQKNYLWTTDYKVELPIRVKKSGFASRAPYTVIKMWKDSLEQFGELAALTYQAKPNEWKSFTFKQYYQECIKVSKSLIALKLTEYSTVNIIGFNSIHWAFIFFGSMFGHYLPIGMYTTNGPEACAYISNHSQAQIVFMEDASHLAKYIKILPEIKTVKYYVIWKGKVPQNLPNQLKGKVLDWEQFISFGQKNYNPQKKEDTIQYRQQIQKPGNCATFIYTSGTTGPPKAVMISHDNYTFVTDSMLTTSTFLNPQKRGKLRNLTLLPLSHVAAQFADFLVPLKIGANLFFTDPSVLQGNLVKFLKIAKPTMFLGVPRIWQKIQEGILAASGQTTGFKKTIAEWAKSIGAEGTYAQLNGGPFPRGWGIAKKLVFNKIKEGLGLQECEYFYFGAAPLKESTRLFFLNLNIYLINVFGMSEVSGPHSMSNPKAFKTFTSIQALKDAGQALPGLQIHINNPDAQGQGQICLRGRNGFMGYFKNQKQTLATVDSKGFIHSGDVGFVAPNNSLSITGRIKELIITAGGENVAPVLIENEINTALPLFSNVVVIGDKLKYLTCLLILKVKSPGVLADDVIAFAKSKGSSATTVKQAIACQKFKAAIQAGINAANEKAISNAQKIQKFTILQNEFSVDTGELTPTLKLKRKIVHQKYEAQINQMYENAKL